MKRIIIVTTMFVISLCLIGCKNQEMEKKYDQGQNNVREGDTEILIYTYNKDVYRVSGNLKLMENEDTRGEILIEIKGGIKKQDQLVNELERKTKNLEKVSDRASVLTVYEKNQVYGFYSHREPFVQTIDGEKTTVFYGYLEGVYDESNETEN